jgi:glycosyltransferase involved in cell wall biosynthesis
MLESPPLSETIELIAADRTIRDRVLVVARWPVGGIRTHLRHNCPTIHKAGYRCTFVLPQDESFAAAKEALDGLSGTEFIGVPMKGRDCPLWKTVRPLLRSGRFALVHAHGMVAAAHCALAGLGQKTPFIATLHDPFREEHFRGLAGSLKRWLLGRALARTSLLITVTADMRANLFHYFPNLRRQAPSVVTLPNGIDASRYEDPPPPMVLRDDLRLKDGVTLIGFLGRFMPQKGFVELVQAIGRLVRFGSTPPFHLVAFGSGDYRREYQRNAEKLGLSSCITFCDLLSDVVPVLQDLDLLVVPSLWEASSLVSMEAMAAGVPVLGTDCLGLREVLRDTPSRMVTAGDVSALECGLREALAAPWTQAARAFAPIARERFDNQRSARRLVQLYEQKRSSMSSNLSG